MDDREMITWIAHRFFLHNPNTCTEHKNLTNMLGEELDTLLWEYTQETRKSVILKKNQDEPNIIKACVNNFIAYMEEYLLPEKTST